MIIFLDKKREKLGNMHYKYTWIYVVFCIVYYKKESMNEEKQCIVSGRNQLI